MANSARTTAKSLTPRQLTILHTLFRFRFVTTRLLALTLQTSDDSGMLRRLKPLVEQGYVARHYKPRYHLLGKPASYCLLPKGIAALKAVPGNNYAQALHAHYKDRTASQQFISHQLGILETCCQFRERYGDRLLFRTKIELRNDAAFSDFLPDACLDMNVHGTNQACALFYLQPQLDAAPGKLFRRILDAYDAGSWATVGMVLIVCRSPQLERRIQKQLNAVLESWFGAGLEFYTTSREALAATSQARIWRHIGAAEGIVSLDDGTSQPSL